jgi:hypothetical protein
MRERGRTNITLDAETAEMLRRYLDRLELRDGFRPTAAQVVRGMIVKAEEQTA